MPRRSSPAGGISDPGAVPVRMRFRKWGDRPHWEYDAELVGEDEHGRWVGARVGTRLARPGASFTASAAFVSVVPHDDAYVATFYDTHPKPPGDPVELYVDITTVPSWSCDPATAGPAGVTMTVVDLDLDVVRGRSGRVWVDDEDEFAQHRVRLGYPDRIVRLATTSCDRVHRDVAAGCGAFARGLGQSWLSRLSSAPA